MQVQVLHALPNVGEVAEWSIAAVLKTALGESPTGVRIPPSPPYDFVNNDLVKIFIWVAVIGVVFAVLWRKGYLERLANYVRSTREELKRCTWPTIGELQGSTVVVDLIITLLLRLIT